MTRRREEIEIEARLRWLLGAYDTLINECEGTFATYLYPNHPGSENWDAPTLCRRHRTEELPELRQRVTGLLDEVKRLEKRLDFYEPEGVEEPVPDDLRRRLLDHAGYVGKLQEENARLRAVAEAAREYFVVRDEVEAVHTWGTTDYRESMLLKKANARRKLQGALAALDRKQEVGHGLS